MTTNYSHSDIELNYEIEMTEDKLREILNVIDNAKKQAQIGQVLRVKLNHNTIIVFRNLAQFKTINNISRESEEAKFIKPHEAGLN